MTRTAQVGEPAGRVERRPDRAAAPCWATVGLLPPGLKAEFAPLALLPNHGLSGRSMAECQ